MNSAREQHQIKAGSPLLTVGELAKSAGLTIRALHHYDSIGLLQPSARSEAGYRLYDSADLARLYAIQALRGFGLSLGEITKMLAQGMTALPEIVSRQIESLDRDALRAGELRDSLRLLQQMLSQKQQPQTADWLAALESMAVFGRHFSAAELEGIFAGWRRIRGEFKPLIEAVRTMMEQGVPPEDLAVQPLARRWIDLSLRWMEGDRQLLGRWREMLCREGSLPEMDGVDPLLTAYVGKAIDLRHAALLRHVSVEEAARLAWVSDEVWGQLATRARVLMTQGHPAESHEAQTLAAEWRALSLQMAGGEPRLLEKLSTAYREETVLQAGMALEPEVRAYLDAADRAGAAHRPMQEASAPPVIPDNIVRRGMPSRTAVRVATLRAVHELLDEPLVLDDPIALPILGRKAEEALRDDPFQYNDPMSRSLRASLVVRSRFAEDELARAVTAGVRQYVILGAGLDTFAYRNPHESAGLQVFEVDHPATQQWKRERLSETGISLPKSLTFAAVDFEHGTLERDLAQAGFLADQPACFSWLGVTMYLTEAAVMDLLRVIAGMAQGSSIVFDYRVPPDQLDPIGRAIAEAMEHRAAAVGEPWISAFDTELLRQKILDLGYGEVEAWEPEALNRRYLYRRKDGLRTGGRLVCARL